MSLTLRKMVIKPTVRCFHQCCYCNRRQVSYQSMAAEKSELSLEIAKHLVAEGHKLGVREIVISGGDPLLYQPISELLRFIRGYGDIVVLINSVAANLSEETATEMLSAGIDGWNISIDSPIAEKHDEIRGVKGAFESSMKGLRVLHKTIKKIGAATRINFMTVITSNNYIELPQLVKLACIKGVASIYLMKVYGFENSRLHILSPQQILHLRECIRGEILDVLREAEVDDFVINNAEHVLDELYPIGTTTIEEFATGRYWRSIDEINSLCKIPNYYVLVKPNGEVLPCCAMEVAHDEKNVVGNIFDNSLSEVWDSQAFHDFRGKRANFCVFCPINYNRTLGLVKDMCKQFLY